MRVHVLESCSDDAAPADYSLNLQWCRYNYDDGGSETGYRWIWTRPVNGRGNRDLMPTRGQARIPTFEDMRRLMAKAEAEGWGGHVGV